MLNSGLGPENVSVNKMEKSSAFLNGASVQVGHVTNKKINKYETNAGVMSAIQKNLAG